VPENPERGTSNEERPDAAHRGNLPICPLFPDLIYLAYNLTVQGQTVSAMTTEKMTGVGEEALQKDSSGAQAASDAKKMKKEKKSKKKSKEDVLKEELEEVKIQLKEQNEKFLRLFAEFDNYKKRTAKERLELMKTAGQDIIEELLPILDDFDRAGKSMEETEDFTAVKKGFDLIREKIFKKLEFKGLEPMDSLGKDFDPDYHEAITEIPVQDENQKGKVVDVIEKGYTLNQKIIRYAKVVVGK
jgi:molecular chaperone GrpE